MARFYIADMRGIVISGHMSSLSIAAGAAGEHTRRTGEAVQVISEETKTVWTNQMLADAIAEANDAPPRITLPHWAYREGEDAAVQGYCGPPPYAANTDAGNARAQWIKGYLDHLRFRLEWGLDAIPQKG